MDDEANNPDDGVDLLDSVSADSEAEQAQEGQAQMPEDTAETAEIQGKEVSDLPVSDPPMNIVKFEPKNFEESIDHKIASVEDSIFTHEALAVQFAKTGKIHAAYNFSWREEAGRLFRLHTRLRKRKKEATAKQLKAPCAVAADYAYSWHDIQRMKKEGNFPPKRIKRAAPAAQPNKVVAPAADASKPPSPSAADSSEDSVDSVSADMAASGSEAAAPEAASDDLSDSVSAEIGASEPAADEPAASDDLIDSVSAETDAEADNPEDDKDTDKEAS